MTLSEKYGIPENKIKELYKDKLLVNWAFDYETIYNYYKQFRAEGLSKPDAITATHEKSKVCERTVYNVVKFFE